MWATWINVVITYYNLTVFVTGYKDSFRNVGPTVFLVIVYFLVLAACSDKVLNIEAYVCSVWLSEVVRIMNWSEVVVLPLHGNKGRLNSLVRFVVAMVGKAS